MNIEQLTTLREKTNITQAQVANALGITTRTVANWEAAEPQKELPQSEARYIREFFQPILLGNQVRDMVQQAFDAIKSEMVAIWLVQETECFVLPNTSYFHFSPDLQMEQSAAPLAIESLTTYPLRSGETVNLAGKSIQHHKAKKYKHNRANRLFKDGRCESMLHVPAFTPSPRGPQPVLLLSLENKLEKKFRFSVGLEFQDDLEKLNISEDLRQKFESNGCPLGPIEKVSIEKRGNEWKIADEHNHKRYIVGKEESKLNIYEEIVIVVEDESGVTKLYTEEDEETAKSLAEGFKDRLIEDMRLLDMIE